MTNELERQALGYIRKIDELGGMVEAIEQGYPQREIAAASYRFSREMETQERVMVGVNAYVAENKSNIPLLKIDEQIQREKVAALQAFKATRDAAKVASALAAVRAAAASSANLMPPIIEAAKVGCTQQEICDQLRGVFGTYTDPAEF
jgi:methylmalonyl-CoA mutase N-terminal domain/subunit